MGCNKQCCLIATAIAGLVMAILGGVLIPIGNQLVYDGVKTDAVLTPDSTAYEAWLEPPVPVYMEYWVWDLRNPEQFKQGAVPVLQQKGPYAYKEYLAKHNVIHNPNGTISYRPSTTYVFDREKSVGPESDTFTTVNLVAFTLASFFKYTGTIPQSAVKLIHELSKAELTLELSVYDILWGYEDAYLKLFQDELGEDVIPFTKFGLFLGTNGTQGVVWTVYDGVNDLSKLNVVNVWDGMEKLPWWTTPWANMINGTDGAAFHPYIQEDELLYVYVPDICRSGYMLFDKWTKIKGIPVAEWYVPSDLYANPEEVPDNIGFCTPDKYSCVPTGLINVTECYFGAPIFFSSPHFLYGENLLSTVEGLQPVEDEHKIYFALEMLAGVPFEIDNRIQINLKVEPYEFLPLSQGINALYYPVIWLNESSGLDQENADLYLSDVIMPQRLLYAMTYILLGAGAGMFFGATIALIRLRISNKKRGGIDEQFLEDSVKQVSENKAYDPDNAE